MLYCDRNGQQDQVLELMMMIIVMITGGKIKEFSQLGRTANEAELGSRKILGNEQDMEQEVPFYSQVPEYSLTRIAVRNVIMSRRMLSEVAFFTETIFNKVRKDLRQFLTHISQQLCQILCVVLPP